MCLCAVNKVQCQNSCQSLQENTQQDDINDTPVKMQSPSDSSAELKGQSCHSSGEHEAEVSNVVERIVGCPTQAVQVSHAVSTSLPIKTLDL